MSACRVLLVENERSAYERCAQIIAKHEGVELAAGAESFAEGKAALEAHADSLDILLTDLQLGDGDGTDLISLWRQLPVRPGKPARRAMVISVFGDVTSVVRAVEAGADGYLLKGGSDEEMVSSITTVLEGGAPISAAVAGHLLRRVRRTADPDKSEVTASTAQLSQREVEVLKWLARGHSYKEVARDMGLSPYTVGDHVKRIYQKLAVGSRGEAVYEAIRGGLIDLDE